MTRDSGAAAWLRGRRRVHFRSMEGEREFHLEDERALIEQIEELERIVRGLLHATDRLTHLEGAPRAIAELSEWRIRARAYLARADESTADR